MPKNFLAALTNSPVFPAVEFSLIIALIITTYWGMHIGSFRHIRPITKMSVSMLLGSLGYIAGKTIVIALFASKATSTYAF